MELLGWWSPEIDFGACLYESVTGTNPFAQGRELAKNFVLLLFSKLRSVATPTPIQQLPSPVYGGPFLQTPDVVINFDRPEQQQVVEVHPEVVYNPVQQIYQPVTKEPVQQGVVEVYPVVQHDPKVEVIKSLSINPTEQSVQNVYPDVTVDSKNQFYQPAKPTALKVQDVYHNVIYDPTKQFFKAVSKKPAKHETEQIYPDVSYDPNKQFYKNIKKFDPVSKTFYVRRSDNKKKTPFILSSQGYSKVQVNQARKARQHWEKDQYFEHWHKPQYIVHPPEPVYPVSESPVQTGYPFEVSPPRPHPLIKEEWVDYFENIILSKFGFVEQLKANNYVNCAQSYTFVVSLRWLTNLLAKL